MGNRSSGMTSEMPAMSYAPTPREGNVYEPGFPPPPTLSSAPGPTSSIPSSSPAPPTPPRGLERRTMTTVARDRHRDYSRGHSGVPRRMSASDASTSASSPVDATSDDLALHVTENRPRDNEENVPLGTTITVFFDKDVKTVNANKLFEVHCNSVDPSLNPVKGRISYDARQQRAEFTPLNTLFPNSKYTVILLGRAVTTSQCTHSANIKNAELHFNTCNPAPKHIGIKLKGQSNEPDRIQIANYYDLYNSLILWSTRKWGCSGEHVTGMFTQNKDGKLQPLKADLDVLNLKEDEVVVVEIKD